MTAETMATTASRYSPASDGRGDHAELGDEARRERHAGLGQQEHGEQRRPATGLRARQAR